MCCNKMSFRWRMYLHLTLNTEVFHLSCQKYISGNYYIPRCQLDTFIGIIFVSDLYNKNVKFWNAGPFRLVYSSHSRILLLLCVLVRHIIMNKICPSNSNEGKRGVREKPRFFIYGEVNTCGMLNVTGLCFDIICYIFLVIR